MAKKSKKAKAEVEAPVQFQFVGASEGTTSQKVTWPVEAQAIVIRNNVVGKLGATATFENGVAEYNELVAAGEIQGSPMPTELPPSYTNKNAGSVLYGMKQRFIKRVNNKDARGHTETLEAAQRFGVIQPAGESVETYTTDDIETISQGEQDALDLDRTNDE